MDTEKEDFSNDFIDFLNDDIYTDEMEISTEVISTIRLLEDERDPHKRLNDIKKLTRSLLPKLSIEELDEKLLQHLLPIIKGSLSSIYGEICQVSLTIDLQQKSTETLTVLQDYLQMCISIYEIIDYVLECILQAQEETEFSKLHSVPLNVLEMIFVTFEHCKQSDKLYKVYFEDLKEIFTLFKNAQEVHTKILNLLEKRINYNVLTNSEVDLLIKILDILTEIGIVLVDMNIKALADNWKGYLCLTQKLSDYLNQNTFDLYKPVYFLTKEVCRNINNVLSMNANDDKGISQILKMCNFFTRIILKLCETFWVGFKKLAVDFLSQIYGYYPPMLKHKNYPGVMVREIEITIFDVSNTLIKKIMSEPEFAKELTSIEIKSCNATGYLFLFTDMLQNILVDDNHCLNSTNYYYWIQFYFIISSKCYFEDVWALQISSKINRQSTSCLYDVNISNIIKITLLLNNDDYSKVELLFFENILKDNTFVTVLAADIWISYLRKKSHLQLIYDTLLQIVITTRTFLMDTFTLRPEKVHLESFLKRLYLCLTEELKVSLLQKFPIETNFYLWKCVGFKEFPDTHILKPILNNNIDKMESLMRGECSVYDFDHLNNGLELISSFPVQNITNLRSVLSTLTNLWNLDIKSNDSSYRNSLFEHFIDRLCQASNNLITHFNNKQLFLILFKLKCLTNYNSALIKIRIGQILTSLSTRSFRLTLEWTQITKLISEIFIILLHEKNCVINQYSLQVFSDFVNVTPHEEILQLVLKNDDALRNTVSNFLQKNVIDKPMPDGDLYLRNKNKLAFCHICPIVESVKKCDIVDGDRNLVKKRIDENEVVIIMSKIKEDIKLLHIVCGKEELYTETINDVVQVLSRKVGFKI